MPVAPASGFTSFDPTANLNARDVSKAFYMIKKDETPLLNEIGVWLPAKNTKHYWWDDKRQIRGTSLTTYAIGSPTAMVVVSTEGLRANMLIAVLGKVYRITSVTNATTLVVAYVGGVTNATGTTGDAVEFLGSSVTEGEDYKASDYSFEIERMNVTQIMDDTLKVTGTQRAITREINDGDLVLQMANKKLERLYLQLARSIWANPLVSPADNVTARVMGGVDHFLGANGLNITTPTAITAAAFDDWLLNLDKAGANLGEFWVNPVDLKWFAAIDASKLQYRREDQTRGVFVDKYISKYGHELQIRTDIQAPVGKIRAMRKENIGLVPLQGREFQIQDLDKTGDSEKKLLVGEYTLEVRNSAVAGFFVPV